MKSDYQTRSASHQKAMDELHKPKRFVTETKAVINPTPSDLYKINGFLCEQCVPLRQKLQKLEYFDWKHDDGSFFFRSSRINIFKDIGPQYREALWSMDNFLRTLHCMKIEVKIENVGWHNVMDMSENIQGNLGFYILNYSVKFNA